MDLLTLPETAAEEAHARLAPEGGPLRLSYFCGPGDVLGTYRHWQAGQHDPRVPIIAYSAMFFELVRRLGARAQVISSSCPETDPGGEIRFAAVQRRPWRNKAGYIRSQGAIVRDVAARVAEFDPHVVIASTDLPPAGWPALGQGRRLVVSAHNTLWPMGQDPAGFRGRLALRRLSAQARAIGGAVCVSDECARQIATVTAGRVQGPVAVPQIVERYPVRARSRARRLLFLGRIEANKGVFMLLDAFAALAPAHPGLELVLAGTGSQDDELRRRIAAAGLPGLRFLGRLDSDRVHDQIAAADLIVCPTTSGFSEGLATVGPEGAAHGVPTLMSSVVPAQDLLGPGGAVFPADDTAALTRALERLISDETAYQSLVQSLEPVRARLYDRAQSWGSQLGRVLLAL